MPCRAPGSWRRWRPSPAFPYLRLPRTFWPVPAELLASLGHPAVTGRVSTGDWFAVKGQRAEWIRGTFSPLLTEMEGGAIAQVCLRNGVRFVSVKSVSDHLFSDSQAEEYFDFGQALEALGRAVLPLAKALQKAGR